MATSSASAARPRDLFPLPRGAIGADVAQTLPMHATCRTCRRRGDRRLRVGELCEDAICALSEMASGGGPGPRVAQHSPTVAQAAALDHIKESAIAFGRPPPGLSGPGALEELRATRSYGSEAATIVPITYESVDRVSLPVVGFQPSPLLGIGDDLGRKLVDGMRELEYPRSEGRERARLYGPRRVYTDPNLRSSRTYVRLLKRLVGCGLVEFRSFCTCEVGVFGVAKKDATIRLILDGRRASEFFRKAPKVRLASGGAFSGIEVDEGEPVWVSGVDISNAFYAIGLPDYFKQFFGLPKVRADKVGIAATSDGRRVRSHDYVYPCFCCPPMGWSISLWLCQGLSSSIPAQVPSLDDGNRFVDHAPVPSLRDHRNIHTSYVDNFVNLSLDGGLGLDVATKVKACFEKEGLPCHDVEHGKGGSTLGWEFSSTWPTLGINLKLRWRIYAGLRELYLAGADSAGALECIGGQLPIRTRAGKSAGHGMAEREEGATAGAELDDFLLARSGRSVVSAGACGRCVVVGLRGPIAGPQCG